MSLRQRFHSVRLAGLLLSLAAPSFAGTVDLSFRPSFQTSGVGAIVNVDIVAVSSDDTDDAVGAIGAILYWDPAYLQFVGFDNSNAGYNWYHSDLAPADPDGINDDLTDGDLYYVDQCQLGDPALVPPSPGLVVTTVQFTALQETDLTTIGYLESLGQFSETHVIDFNTSLPITGDIDAVADVAICPLPGCTADLDGDCDVDQADLGELLSWYNQGDGGDIDGDGDTDQSDLGILLSEYGNVCY
ncbi:MAG: hypothetical protein ACF8NJ_11300 [Phycisphaerales bacterium JB038]